MNFAIQNLTFEERSKINDLFDAPYYNICPISGGDVAITAIGADKFTLQGQLRVTKPSKFSQELSYPISSHYQHRFALPREAFLLGITLCLVDDEPYWFLGAAMDIKGTDDRQYFGVIHTSFSLEDITELNQPKVTIVNDIDNRITLLAPVLDAQAMFQPDDEED